MVNLNGKLFRQDEPLFLANNRAFRYGDSLFESIRMFDGKMPFLHMHIDRLIAGMAAMRLKIPPGFTTEFFDQEIKKITTNNSRIRLVIFRSGSGFYFPEVNEPVFFIEAQALGSSSLEWNENGLKVGAYNEWSITPSKFSFFKTGSAMPLVIANLFKKENGLDDILLLNNRGNVVCGGSSNVFIVNKDKIFTPPISEGCVDGIMKKVLLNLSKKNGIECVEQPISMLDIKEADELFLSNAVQGIKWVEKVEGVEKAFNSKMGEKLSLMLNSLIAEK